MALGILVSEMPAKFFMGATRTGSRRRRQDEWRNRQNGSRHRAPKPWWEYRQHCRYSVSALEQRIRSTDDGEPLMRAQAHSVEAVR
jgi:hypothetical protein